MKRIKDYFKRSNLIVFVYETIMNGIYKCVIEIEKNCRKIKTFFTVKTHFNYGSQNRDKTFFVIVSPNDKMGLYSTILYILPFIEYALRKNYIPIIDFKRSYIPMIQDKEKKGKENAWEYYYEQPIPEYKLEEVYQSRHVIVMIEHTTREGTPDWRALYSANISEINYWNRMIMKYIRPQKELRERISKLEQQLLDGKKVLGVGVRAEYRAGFLHRLDLYRGHSEVPSCEDMINATKKIMFEWDYEYIFLSCDDREYSQKFINYFGDKCLHMDRRLYHFFENDKPIPFEDSDKIYIEIRGSSVRELTEEYLVETYLLAKCDGLYASKNGGSLFAYLLNGGKYSNFRVYSNEVYEW